MLQEVLQDKKEKKRTRAHQKTERGRGVRKNKKGRVSGGCLAVFSQHITLMASVWVCSPRGTRRVWLWLKWEQREKRGLISFLLHNSNKTSSEIPPSLILLSLSSDHLLETETQDKKYKVLKTRMSTVTFFPPSQEMIPFDFEEFKTKIKN